MSTGIAILFHPHILFFNFTNIPYTKFPTGKETESKIMTPGIGLNRIESLNIILRYSSGPKIMKLEQRKRESQV